MKRQKNLSKEGNPKIVPNNLKKEDTEPVTNEPTGSSRRPERRSFLRRLSDNLSTFKYVIIVLIVPPVLNFGALKREAITLLPKGEKVDMGWGQKMYIHCKGEGLPTVVLDSPTGLTSDIWVFAHEELAKYTRVCVYDRSGLGRSDPIFTEMSPKNLEPQSHGFIAQPHSLEQMTSDLHYLLNHAKPLPRPFILVGADVGSLIARLYSMVYPSDVNNIVLIDPLVENLFPGSDELKDYWFSNLLPYYESLHLSAILGISRLALLTGLLNPVFFREGVSEELIFWQKSLLCNPTHMNSVFYEHLFMNSSFSQMRDALSMRPFPSSVAVSVLMRERPAELPSHLHKELYNSQKKLVEHLHPQCHHEIIKDSDFLQMYAHPSAIISTVKDIVKSWRNKPPPSF